MDSINVIQGTPVPDDETVVPGDGVDLVNPDLTRLVPSMTTERYSFLFDGSAQSLDHILANEALMTATIAQRVEHARIGADFPETARNDGASPIRLADHDPVVAYFALSTLETDLGITTTNGLTAVVPGETVTYTIVASNAGPGAVVGATVSSSLPAGFTAVTWTCTGSGGGTCGASGSGDISEAVNLPVGGSVTFTLAGSLDPAAFGSLANTAIILPPLGVIDPDTSNNLATDTDPLTPRADLSVTKTDGQASATPGGTVVYTIVASNAGPSAATGATVVDSVPSAITGATWSCSGASGGSCGASSGSGSIDESVSLPVGASVTFILTGTVDPAATGTLTNSASVSPPAGVTDLTSSNDTATDTNTLSLGFYALTPCRVVDTRGGAPVGGPALAGGESRSFLLAGQCGISSTATAVSLNVTVTGATAPGHIRLFPAGAVPSISTINYSAGQTRANNAVMTLSETGELSAFAAQAAGTAVHLIIDVNGYFQ